MIESGMSHVGSKYAILYVSNHPLLPVRLLVSVLCRGLGAPTFPPYLGRVLSYPSTSVLKN